MPGDGGPNWSGLVEEEEAGERLDRHLGAKLQPRYSRSYLAGLIRDGRVLVNGVPVKPSYRLESGDELEADLGPPPREAPLAEEFELDVMYEDDHVVVLDKPAGMLVHPVGGSARGGSLVNGLLWRYPEIQTVGVVLRPGIVHRLDRQTSGVMVVARSNPARLGLSRQFKERTVKKEYRALVEGKVALASDYVDLPIGPHPRHHGRMRIDLLEGKPSSTYYEVHERYQGFTELRVMPLSGRTHQIRLHMSQIGHTVVADGIYGRAQAHHWRLLCERRREQGLPNPRLERHALHAHRLRFTHPLDGRLMDFRSPIPADMVEAVELVRDEGRTGPLPRA